MVHNFSHDDFSQPFAFYFFLWEKCDAATGPPARLNPYATRSLGGEAGLVGVQLSEEAATAVREYFVKIGYLVLFWKNAFGQLIF